VRERLDQLVTEMLDKGIRYEDARQELERRFIIHALSRAKGNLMRTAEILGWHRNTLSRRMADHRLTKRARVDPHPRPPAAT